MAQAAAGAGVGVAPSLPADRRVASRRARKEEAAR